MDTHIFFDMCGACDRCIVAFAGNAVPIFYRKKKQMCPPAAWAFWNRSGGDGWLSIGVFRLLLQRRSYWLQKVVAVLGKFVAEACVVYYGGGVLVAECIGCGNDCCPWLFLESSLRTTDSLFEIRQFFRDEYRFRVS